MAILWLLVLLGDCERELGNRRSWWSLQKSDWNGSDFLDIWYEYPEFLMEKIVPMTLQYAYLAIKKFFQMTTLQSICDTSFYNMKWKHKNEHSLLSAAITTWRKYQKLLKKFIWNFWTNSNIQKILNKTISGNEFWIGQMPSQYKTSWEWQLWWWIRSWPRETKFLFLPQAQTDIVNLGFGSTS